MATEMATEFIPLSLPLTLAFPIYHFPVSHSPNPSQPTQPTQPSSPRRHDAGLTPRRLPHSGLARRCCVLTPSGHWSSRLIAVCLVVWSSTRLHLSRPHSSRSLPRRPHSLRQSGHTPSSRWSSAALHLCLWSSSKEIYSVKIPGDPKLGEEKPENRNHALIFTRGEAIQTINMNQIGLLISLA
ncbi:uncharacterized protein LOC116010887 [Ipomoea triloba]|uniref:uncharacterized protein LOC116010887 n=1 Tax=Ipomoea triloba TaxID=35885 RepID=UPI00125E2F94|nr:uncharacterized protein LOC116010887 [Ipomoea triloba]